VRFNPSDRFEKARDLEVNTVPDGYVVYQGKRDHVHYLNSVASVIFELCDGEHSLADIGDILEAAYQLDTAPAEDLKASLERLFEEGLIVPCPA
jgi:hypothetical protein